MDHLQHHMADLLLGEAGNIRLGAVEPIASCDLPRMLGRFLADYPKIRVSVDIANSSTLGERLVQGSLTLPSVRLRQWELIFILNRYMLKSS